MENDELSSELQTEDSSTDVETPWRSGSFPSGLYFGEREKGASAEIWNACVQLPASSTVAHIKRKPKLLWRAAIARVNDTLRLVSLHMLLGDVLEDCGSSNPIFD